MAQRFSRRTLLAAAAATLVANACAHRSRSLQQEFSTAAAAIQSRVGGRIGVYMLDTQSQLELAFNARERFAMCSTFKLMLAAAIRATRPRRRQWLFRWSRCWWAECSPHSRGCS